MPPSLPRLTPHAITALEPRGTQDYLVPDLEIPGLFLRVHPTAVKTFVVRVRRQDGQRLQRCLGEWPQLSLEDARIQARIRIGRLLDGDLDAPDARTFRAVAEAYLNTRVRPSAAPRTLREYERQLKTILYPALGDRRIAGLTSADLLAVLAPYRNRPMWNRLITGLLRPIFRFAATQRLLQADPVGLIGKAKEVPRKPQLRAVQVQLLNEAILRLRAEGRISLRMAYAIQLILATGARVSEVLGLQWDFVHPDLGLIRWPLTKTGEKVFPLTPTLRALLGQITPVAGSPFVLADPKTGQPTVYLRKAWRVVRAEAGLPELRLHDLRHVFGTRSRAEGDLQDAQELLAHRQVTTTARYTHPTLGDLTKVAEAAGAWMLGHAAPPPKDPSGPPEAMGTVQ
ncbi:MAG: tyrosine-type recombinase/integrase [Acidobacteria bacterium]|nr:tyrosine-type recombinase/integrase [Acidobacteriota bacterium]